MRFLESVLPEIMPHCISDDHLAHIHTREDYIHDVLEGIKDAPMSIRVTPHILSVIDWSNPLLDPVRKQFIPMKSFMLPNHPKLSLDSLHETADTPDGLKGLVHRYPDKALFLGQYQFVHVRHF